MPRLPRGIRKVLVRRFDEALARAEADGASDAEGCIARLTDYLLRAFEAAARERGHEDAAAATGREGVPERLARSLRPGASAVHEPGLHPCFREDVDGVWLVGRFERVLGIVWLSAPAAPAATGPAAPLRPAPRVQEVEVAPGVEAIPYSPDEAYALGDVLQHAKFGTGRVVSAEPGRIRVQFRDQLRVLAHAGGRD